MPKTPAPFLFFLFVFFSLFCHAPKTDAASPASLPGAAHFNDARDKGLAQEIKKMKQTRDAGQTPRSKHLNPDGSPTYTNRLFLETSPYLLQHAHNPVNWFPWGKEAFDAAIKLNRPILLSIGYSTCHWCHVMEEESFEDIEIARFINEHYIAVKVDREQRPDIDSIYMKALNAMTGTGGWPMTLWLTPEKEPFHGGSYFPARDFDRGNLTGFLTLLKRIAAAAANPADWEKIKRTGKLVADTVKKHSIPTAPGPTPGREVIDRAIETYKTIFDPIDGGVKGDIKFPSSFPVRLFFRQFNRLKEADLIEMAELTLDKMKSGGIYDHVGGGFHRYSTDKFWIAPHFEKMLYDNALLAVAYVEAYQLTQNESWKKTAVEILDYLIKEMRSPEGGFYSATDADSLTPSGKSEEGYFFTWTAEEIDAVFDPQTAAIVKKYFSVDMDGTDYRHILHVSESDPEIAAAFDITEKELERVIEEAKTALYAKRAEQRAAPGLDDKIIASWNGLAISALAKAGFILGRNDYIRHAEACAGFIMEKLFVGNQLFRSHNNGQRDHVAFLEDYAFLTAGLLDLYEATFDVSWFKKALELDDILKKEFEDDRCGGFFMTSISQEELISREKPVFDGAIPSGNSVAVMNLIRISLQTGQKSHMERAEKAINCFSGNLSQSPEAMYDMLLAIDLLTGKKRELAIIYPKGKRLSADPFLSVIKNNFLPGITLIAVQEGEEAREMAKLMPTIHNKTAIRGKAAAYLCEDYVCMSPVTEIRELEEKMFPKKNPEKNQADPGKDDQDQNKETLLNLK